MAPSAFDDKSKKPGARQGVFSDVKNFILKKPEIETLINTECDAARQNYSQRIAQRIGVYVSKYSVLNIHRIGIEAPVSLVFEELTKWDGNSKWWPNGIAKVVRLDESLEKIDIILFGGIRQRYGLKSRLSTELTHLFNLNAIRFHRNPEPLDVDNARYLLYECSGGYPIGLYWAYIRSSIAEQHEIEISQAFFGVGFDFFGHRNWSKGNIIIRSWEGIHNRVTANILAKFKKECESKFDLIRGLKK